MDMFFKPVLIIAVIFCLFAFLFVQSGTLETRQEEYTDRGMPMKRTIYNLHWDRFSGYVHSIPDRISSWFRRSN